MPETIILKTCRICKETKPISEFSKDCSRPDGHQSACKICNAKYRKEYNQTEHGRTINRKRAIRYIKTEKGKAAYRKANLRYRKTEKGKICFRAAKKHSRIQYPERYKAGHAVNHAVAAGRLPRPDSLQCRYCLARAKQYHHHKGYAPKHWLDVIPVCVKCHHSLPFSQTP